MKWNEDSHQKLLVFCFQWQGEPVNNRSKDLKKLSYSVKVLGLINKPEVGGRIIKGQTNDGSKVHYRLTILLKLRTSDKTKLPN